MKGDIIDSPSSHSLAPSVPIGDDAPAAERPIICFPFTGDVVGGNHISSLGLIKALDRGRFEPLVVLRHGDGPLAELLREQQVEFEPGPAFDSFIPGRSVPASQLIRHIGRVPALARYLRQRHVALVHVNSGRSAAAWGVAARMAGANLVWHQRGNPAARGVRWIAPWLADYIIAVSEFARPTTWGPGRAPVKVVHNPFATDRTEDRAACRKRLLRELGCPAHTALVGFFGALIARKRPLLFVEAIAKLHERRSSKPVIGLLVGEAYDGFDAAVDQRAAALGISDCIRRVGFRHPSAPWLAGCDILAVPAHEEPFGRTLVEAMLLGTPVVATRSGGNAEAIAHGVTGLLIPPDDSDAFAHAIAHLLSDHSLRRSIASAAKTEARSRYGRERHARAVMQIYDEILTPARPNGRATS